MNVKTLNNEYVYFLAVDTTAVVNGWLFYSRHYISDKHRLTGNIKFTTSKEYAEIWISKNSAYYCSKFLSHQLGVKVKIIKQKRNKIINKLISVRYR